MSKRTPKNSKKKHKAKEKQENLIIIGIFIVFVLVVAYLFYVVKMPTSSNLNENIVAVINGNEITKQELDWWYKLSIEPEYADLVTKQDFLMMSLIPQEVLTQKADKENIKVNADEAEKLLGLFLIDNGITLEEFEEQLNAKSITIDDIKKSFESRAMIMKLMEKENVGFIDEGNFNFNENDGAFQEYVDNLLDDADIKIFPENIDRLILKNFKETGDELCNENKPILRLYTSTSCKVCNDTTEIFNNLVEKLVEDETVEAFHWSLDTGDDLMTSKKEKGIPKEELALFKKNNPNNRVPALNLGCKYTLVGNVDSEAEDESREIIKNLIGA
ncbi:hypothetical protein CL615_04305 [archaeon]|jgi:hypothetical protein|nr:hypothetical protein [archaeon]MDP6548425.1 hypothetical protein [Candidatus Woesearchaeota archaeon]|tara:strand:+ start:10492 stop:11484 length:993 start_codon:yes stop_codon:yes gene_type:complete